MDFVTGSGELIDGLFPLTPSLSRGERSHGFRRRVNRTHFSWQDLMSWWTSCSPSPLPSPSGRGSHGVRARRNRVALNVSSRSCY